MTLWPVANSLLAVYQQMPTVCEEPNLSTSYSDRVTRADRQQWRGLLVFCMTESGTKETLLDHEHGDGSAKQQTLKRRSQNMAI